MAHKLTLIDKVQPRHELPSMAAQISCRTMLAQAAGMTRFRQA